MATAPPLACSPDDGIDDRECLQGALTTLCAAGGGTLELPPGTWNLTRPASVPGTRDSASLWLECALTLRGEAGAVLMMTGDGYAADWSGVRAVADGVSVEDLTIASDASANPNEQTHLLFFGATGAAPTAMPHSAARRLTLRHPVVAAVSGDCLRTAGSDATPVGGVFEDLIFESCDRSGWSVQRGVSHLAFRRAVFINIGKTGIDMEPSAGLIADVDMSDLYLMASGISIAGGEGPIYAQRITLRDSFIGGRLGISVAKNVAITDVTIADVARGGEGSLHIRGSDGVTMTRGSIRRLPGSVAGPAVKAVGTNGVFPGNIRIVGTTIASDIAGSVVDLESIQGVTLMTNSIAGADLANGAGISARAVGRDIKGLRFLGNRIAGMAYAVRLAGVGTGGTVSGAVVAGNVSGAIGLRCENPQKFVGPVIHVGGAYGGATASGCP
jgi:hypothetical protein